MTSRRLPVAASGAAAQLLERPGMHLAVLADLETGQVEAEGLGLPEQVLELTERLPGGARPRQRPLHEAEVGDELRRTAVGQAGLAVALADPDRVQPPRRVQQVDAVGLLRGAHRDLGEQAG